MKIKFKLILCLLSLVNLMTVSCQTKSEEINLSILNEPSKNVIGSKETYPLRYRDFVDSLHSRLVLQESYIQDRWQPFIKDELKLNYMDVYFNKEKVIGFKGTFETKAKNNSDEVYERLNNYIASNKNFKLIKLSNNDTSVLNNEYESNDIIIGIRYEKPNKYITITSIYKKELISFYDKIFYSEFLNLTKFRDKNSQIKLKELYVLPSESEKDFYRHKINEIKKEYNKNQ